MLHHRGSAVQPALSAELVGCVALLLQPDHEVGLDISSSGAQLADLPGCDAAEHCRCCERPQQGARSRDERGDQHSEPNERDQAGERHPGDRLPVRAETHKHLGPVCERSDSATSTNHRSDADTSPVLDRAAKKVEREANVRWVRVVGVGGAVLCIRDTHHLRAASADASRRFVGSATSHDHCAPTAAGHLQRRTPHLRRLPEVASLVQRADRQVWLWFRFGEAVLGGDDPVDQSGSQRRAVGFDVLLGDLVVVLEFVNDDGNRSSEQLLDQA